MKTNVISHRTATDLLAKNDSRFVAEEVKAAQMQGKYDHLPYYGEILPRDTQPIHLWQFDRNQTLNDNEKKYGKIANPAVHMILNQIRLVVNEIIKLYGKPYEINIELGRDVGLSSKRKVELEKSQKRNKKLNDEAVEYIKERKIQINYKNILKYKLAKQQNFFDAFDPTQQIPQDFNGFEIEHLIPQSKGGSDAPNNLVLINANANKDKGNMYPYDYLSNYRSPEQLRDILKTIRTSETTPKGNKWRFEPEAQEKFEQGEDLDATTRYLTDTKYVAKLAGRYLRAILNTPLAPIRRLLIYGFCQ